MPKRIHANIGVLLVLMAMVSVSSVRGADNLGVLQGVVKDAAGDGQECHSNRGKQRFCARVVFS
jgi:hypothetical protein